MIIDIIIIAAWIYIIGAMFGVNDLIGRGVRQLPPVKRRMIAGERRKRDRQMLREIEADEERQRNAALRALTVADVAFLSAGGHWTPPESVRERMRQKEFELTEYARQQLRITETKRRVEEEQTKRAALLRSDAEVYAKSAVARQQQVKWEHAQRVAEIERASSKLSKSLGMSTADVDSVYRPKARQKPYLRKETVTNFDGREYTYTYESNADY